MKKLLFATVLVASVAAFAEGPINAISFEGYAAGDTFSNGGAEKEESPAGNGAATISPFFFYDGEQDGSSVKAFGGENASAPNISPRSSYFSGSNLNYLDLSTEGGILWRGINEISSDNSGETTTWDLGNSTNIVAGGLYLDTLVQFTPTEDGGDPELETGVDKLAIWLNVDSSVTPSVTNLQVRANLYDFGEAPSAAATTFTLVASNNLKTVVAGEWYRLTVKAIPNVMNTDENGVIPAFEIYIDGIPMYATTAQFTSAMADMLSGMSALSEDAAAAIAANKLFPSLAEMGGQGSTPTLTAVGFKGSGALDDIVWTTEDPFASSGVDYQVTIGDAVVPITLSAEDVTALGTALLDAGITGTDLLTPAGVNAALAGTIGSSGIPVWQAFFLGLPLTEDGLESFKITSISFDEDGKVVVTVPASVTLLTGHGVNIVLSLQGSGDLSSWSEVETATITNDKPSFAPVTPGDATKKFYKIVVNFVQTPVVQGS